MGGCTSLNVALYQKLIFGFLNPFMGYFQVHFQTTQNDFFHKTMAFLQMHNAIWQRAKSFLNVKIINLEKKKTKQEKSQPPSPFKKTFHRTCTIHRTCTVLPPPFLIFQIPPLREVIKLYSPLYQKVCVCVCEGVGFSEL